MDRRQLFKTALAVGVVATIPKAVATPPPKVDRAPYDTDDRCYDEWLEDYGKDEMHL